MARPESEDYRCGMGCMYDKKLDKKKKEAVAMLRPSLKGGGNHKGNGDSRESGKWGKERGGG